MTEEYTLYTDPSDDIESKYAKNANKLMVKWSIEMHRTKGMKKATARVIDYHSAIGDDPFSKWEIIEPLRLPDDVREELRDKIIATGMNKYERHIEMADALRVDQ
jgi:hypothetical protein